MLGVNSYSMESNTSLLEITLDDNGNIDFIEVRFIFEGIERTVKFYTQNIGETVVPSWADLNLKIAIE